MTSTKMANQLALEEEHLIFSEQQQKSKTRETFMDPKTDQYLDQVLLDQQLM